MGRITRGIGKTFDTLDFLEMLFYGVMAAALMGVGLYLGVGAALERGGPILAGGLIGLLLVVFGLLLRDARRKSWSPIAVSVGVAWALCIVALIVADIMAW